MAPRSHYVQSIVHRPWMIKCFPSEDIRQRYFTILLKVCFSHPVLSCLAVYFYFKSHCVRIPSYNSHSELIYDPDPLMMIFILFYDIKTEVQLQLTLDFRTLIDRYYSTRLCVYKSKTLFVTVPGLKLHDTL